MMLAIFSKFSRNSRIMFKTMYGITPYFTLVEEGKSESFAVHELEGNFYCNVWADDLNNKYIEAIFKGVSMGVVSTCLETWFNDVIMPEYWPKEKGFLIGIMEVVVSEDFNFITLRYKGEEIEKLTFNHGGDFKKKIKMIFCLKFWSDNPEKGIIKNRGYERNGTRILHCYKIKSIISNIEMGGNIEVVDFGPMKCRCEGELLEPMVGISREAAKITLGDENEQIMNEIVNHHRINEAFVPLLYKKVLNLNSGINISRSYKRLEPTNWNSAIKKFLVDIKYFLELIEYGTIAYCDKRIKVSRFAAEKCRRFSICPQKCVKQMNRALITDEIKKVLESGKQTNKQRKSSGESKEKKKKCNFILGHKEYQELRRKALEPCAVSSIGEGDQAEKKYERLKRWQSTGAGMDVTRVREKEIAEQRLLLSKSLSETYTEVLKRRPEGKQNKELERRNLVKEMFEIKINSIKNKRETTERKKVEKMKEIKEKMEREPQFWNFKTKEEIKNEMWYKKKMKGGKRGRGFSDGKPGVTYSDILNVKTLEKIKKAESGVKISYGYFWPIFKNEEYIERAEKSLLVLSKSKEYFSKLKELKASKDKTGDFLKNNNKKMKEPFEDEKTEERRALIAEINERRKEREERKRENEEKEKKEMEEMRIIKEEREKEIRMKIQSEFKVPLDKEMKKGEEIYYRILIEMKESGSELALRKPVLEISEPLFNNSTVERLKENTVAFSDKKSRAESVKYVREIAKWCKKNNKDLKDFWKKL